MSFLNSLIKDPKYQTDDPRKPEALGEPEVIISPDTRRENRIPPGQSRTKKWPVLDAHGAPLRLIIPQLYAWRSAKWVKGVRCLGEDEAGFWEEGGYHMRGNPWADGDGERCHWS